MIDTITQKPLCVSADCGERPYIIVPMAQLDRVVGLLDANEIPHSVDEEAISVDGKPEVVFIEFGRRTDAAMLQRVIDDSP